MPALPPVAWPTTEALEHVEAVPWDRVDMMPDDKTAYVHFLRDAAGCVQLAEVTADETPTSVMLTLHLGRLPERRCGKADQPARARIMLSEAQADKPLGDGARAGHPHAPGQEDAGHAHEDPGN